MKIKTPDIMLGILLVAIVSGCSKATPAPAETEVVSADGMVDSAETAAADLAKKPHPDARKK